MIIAILALMGLGFGSFVNALVWRTHEQVGRKSSSKEMSILTGRSMCPNCRHKLSAFDLIPVLSWVALRGKCRYCSRPISWQYPVVEVLTAGLFVSSYLLWPYNFDTVQVLLLAIWLVLLVGLIALLVYDVRWQLLPNRFVYPLSALAAIYVIVSLAASGSALKGLLNAILGVAVGGGIFYLLFILSSGNWIGGGDVKLGWLLGLIAGTPGRSFLLIFLAAFLGSLVSLPLLAMHKVKRTSKIPFGPFLIVAMIIVQLFGHTILVWYQRTFFPFTS